MSNPANNVLAQRAWFDAADSALQAARSMKRSHPRSSASRSYYAAFAAAHAVMCHLRVIHRPRAHFKHGEAPAELRWTLLHHQNLGFGQFKADFYKQQLEDAYNNRVTADYKPLVSVDADDAGDSEGAAASLVELARRILK